MSYDKLSLASFTASLKEGKYESATGARRAVGKATTLSDADKDKARKAIDAHFGAGATVAPKKAGAKAAAKKTAAAPKKKAAAAKKTASAKPQVNKPAGAPKKKAAAKKTSAKRAARAVPTETLETTGVGSVSLSSIPASNHDLENIGSIGTKLRLAEKTIQNVGAALNVVTQAKKEYPDADLSAVVEEMGTTLSGAVGIFRSVVHEAAKHGATLAAAPGIPAIQSPAIAAPEAPRPPAIVNNGVLPSRAESLFNESQPQAEQTEV